VTNKTSFDFNSREITGNAPESRSRNASRPSRANVLAYPRSDMGAGQVDGSFGANQRAIQPTGPQVKPQAPFVPNVPAPRPPPKG
jgi:hypothetical protein